MLKILTMTPLRGYNMPTVSMSSCNLDIFASGAGNTLACGHYTVSPPALSIRWGGLSFFASTGFDHPFTSGMI